MAIAINSTLSFGTDYWILEGDQITVVRIEKFIPTKDSAAVEVLKYELKAKTSNRLLTKQYAEAEIYTSLANAKAAIPSIDA